MKRQTLTDGSGYWFDLDRADAIDEGTNWDGSNHVSMATGSQWSHQTLYRTQSGRYVLKSWSQHEGVADTWEQIDDERAHQWLVENDRHETAAEWFPVLNAAAEI